MTSVLRRVQNLFADYPLPDAAWLQAAATPSIHTPDINRLQQRAHWLVFIFDGMKEGFPQNNFLEGYYNPEKVYDSFTVDMFSMWKKRLGVLTQPVILPFHEPVKKTPLLPIRGSLMLLTTSKLIQLDEHIGNGIQCTRKRVDIDIDFHTIIPCNDFATMAKVIPGTVRLRNSQVMVPQTQRVRAFLYVGNPDFWLPQSAFSGRASIIRTTTPLDSRAITDVAVNGSLFSRIERTIPNNPDKAHYYRFSMKEYND